MGSLFSNSEEAPAPPSQSKDLLDGNENRAAVGRAQVWPAPPRFESRAGLPGLTCRVPVRPGGGGAGPEEAPAEDLLRGRARGRMAAAYGVPVRPGGAGPEEAPAGDVLRGSARGRMAAAHGVSAGSAGHPRGLTALWWEAFRRWRGVPPGGPG